MKLILNEIQNKELIYSIKGDPNLLINKQVKVYYDITRHMFSVTFGGIVVLKADYVRLENVKFLVGEKGKEKVSSRDYPPWVAFIAAQTARIAFCMRPVPHSLLIKYTISVPSCCSSIIVR